MEWGSPRPRWGPVRAAQRSRGGVRREMTYDDAIRHRHVVNMILNVTPDSPPAPPRIHPNVGRISISTWDCQTKKCHDVELVNTMTLMMLPVTLTWGLASVYL